jgi:hypothetical protein
MKTYLPFFLFFMILSEVAYSVPIGGGTTNYICNTKDGVDACHCFDYLDCKKLKESGDCKDDLTKVPGDDDQYTCTWKYKSNPDNNHGFVKQEIKSSPNLLAPPSSTPRKPSKQDKVITKPLVVPLVAPVKKTNTRPTAAQPKMRTMSAPTMQPKQPVTKQRVEKSVKRKVATPASTNKNKKLIRQAAPTTSKGVEPKSNQPVMRKMNSAPAVNGSKSKAMPTSKNNFDEADAIFGKRTGVSNTQAR